MEKSAPNAPSASPVSPVAGRPAPGLAAEIAAYVRRVAGPDASGPAIEQALSELEPVTAAGRLDAAAAKQVREAALAAVERQDAALGRRLGRLARLRFGCSAVPLLLGRRASGRTSAPDAARLYRHLDRCQDCAELAGRFEAAEWQLHSQPRTSGGVDDGPPAVTAARPPRRSAPPASIAASDAPPAVAPPAVVAPSEGAAAARAQAGAPTTANGAGAPAFAAASAPHAPSTGQANGGPPGPATPGESAASRPRSTRSAAPIRLPGVGGGPASAPVSERPPRRTGTGRKPMPLPGGDAPAISTRTTGRRPLGRRFAPGSAGPSAAAGAKAGRRRSPGTAEAPVNGRARAVAAILGVALVGGAAAAASGVFSPAGHPARRSAGPIAPIIRQDTAPPAPVAAPAVPPAAPRATKPAPKHPASAAARVTAGTPAAARVTAGTPAADTRAPRPVSTPPASTPAPSRSSPPASTPAPVRKPSRGGSGTGGGSRTTGGGGSTVRPSGPTTITIPLPSGGASPPPVTPPAPTPPGNTPIVVPQGH